MKRLNELDQPAFELAITRCVEQQGKAKLTFHLDNNSSLIEMFVFDETEEGFAYWDFVFMNGCLPTYRQFAD